MKVVYLLSDPSHIFPNQSVTGLIVKEPGPLSLDLVSSCVTVFDNIFLDVDAQLPYQFPVSYPSYNTSYDGFVNSVTGVIYDNDRKLLYVSFNNRPDHNSQDFHQFVITSADNGRTWSAPLYIPKTSNGNRGFLSLAYNTSLKSLVGGWYDAINSVSGTGVQYTGATLNRKELCQVKNSV